MITGKKEYFIDNIFNDERLKEVSIKINYECLLYLINHYKKCRKLLKHITVGSFGILSSYSVHWENPRAFIDYKYDVDGDYDFYYMDNELNILDNYNKETVLKYAVLNEDYFIVDMTTFKNDNKLTIEEYWYNELFIAKVNEKEVSMSEIKKCVIDCLNEALEATNNSFRRQGINIIKDLYSENYEGVNEDKAFLVLFRGLDPIGSAEIYKDFPVLHIKSFAILEKYQNMGYGTRFLEKIYERAKKYCFKEMRLQVANNNENALSIYKKFGFEPFSMAMFAKIKGEDNEKSEIK